MTIIDSIEKYRASKKARLSIIWILMWIVVLLLIFWQKATTILLIILVLLAVAMWLEWYDYDVDLQKYWETWSYSESRVERIKDSNGNFIEIITGNCNRREFDFNCADFETQSEAQNKYSECASLISQNNPWIDIKKLDIYWLDGDKDGIVCEALKK